MNENGHFVISLDFELMWGVRDKVTIDDYGNNIKAVWEVIPKLLSSFKSYEAKATFATVGLLFSRNKGELNQFSPELKPSYTNTNLSPFNGHFEQIGNHQEEDPYHYCIKLIEAVKEAPEHELGSHTFSHYYCIEPGQTVQHFKADLQAAKAISEKEGITLTSLVFPRNQFNQTYLRCCAEEGIITYRGNEKAWYYQPESGGNGSLFKRGMRLLDSYINISGHNIYSMESLQSSFPINIPASRFLRPFSTRLKGFEKKRLNRILKSMTAAAKEKKIYHLWWHPHNFGANMDDNFAFLTNILEHYQNLNEQYGFESITMSNLANKIQA